MVGAERLNLQVWAKEPAAAEKHFQLVVCWNLGGLEELGSVRWWAWWQWAVARQPNQRVSVPTVVVAEE